MEDIEYTADHVVSLICWMLKYEKYPECGVKTFAEGRIDSLIVGIQREIDQHKFTKQRIITHIKSMYDDDAAKAAAHIDMLDRTTLKFTEE